MQLYLLRHADAVPHNENDAARELTEKGHEQSKRAGRFCKKNGIAPEIILSSPLRRAEQTARFAATEMNAEVTIANFLASGMDPETGIAELRSYAKNSSVMIVGHEPDFSRLAAQLLGLPSNERIHLRKSSLTLIDVKQLRAGGGTLEFSLPASLM